MAPRRVAGTVVHAGRPVAGATVWLSVMQTAGPGYPVRETRCDDAGGFDFGAMPARGYVVTAEAPELVAAVIFIDLRCGEDPDPTLRLELGACARKLRGVVRDAGGGGIVGAEVRGATPGLAVLTDARGAYVRCVAGEDTSIEVMAAGYGTVTVSAMARDATSLDVVLLPEVTLTGRVTLAGAAVAGAVVCAEGPSGRMVTAAVTATDDDGRFHLDRLAARDRPTQVVVRHERGRATREIRAMRPGDVMELDVALEATERTIRGRVLSGVVPAAGVRVSVHGKDASGDAVSQVDGRFVVEGLTREPLTISSDQQVVAPAEGVLAADVDDVAVEIEPQPAIRGQVIRRGVPVPRARVTLSSAGISFLTDADDSGQFALPLLAPGPVQLSATDPATGASSGRHDLDVPAAGLADVVLELETAASVSGVVIDQQGAPASGVRVSLRHARGQGWGFAATGADGAFRVDALTDPGDFLLFVENEVGRRYGLADARAATVHVPDAAAQITGVRVAILRDNLTIAGIAVRGDAPVPYVTIHAMRKEGAHGGTTITGPDGRFVVTRLAQGVHHLIAQLGDQALGSVDAEAGASDVRFELADTGSVHLELDGFSRGARVYLIPHDRSTGPFAVRADVPVTVLDDLVVGAYQLKVADDRGGVAVADVSIAADRIARVRLVAKTATLKGRVVDVRSGAPVVGVRCMWSGAQHHVQLGLTDAGGRFSGGVPAGVGELGCEGPTVAHARPVPVELAAGAHGSFEVPVVVSHHPLRSVGLELRSPTLEVSAAQGNAAAAGLAMGDVIVRVDGREVAGFASLAVYLLLCDHAPGEAVIVDVQRGREVHRAAFVVP